jgi:hypothetical protein
MRPSAAYAPRLAPAVERVRPFARRRSAGPFAPDPRAMRPARDRSGLHLQSMRHPAYANAAVRPSRRPGSRPRSCVQPWDAASARQSPRQRPTLDRPGFGLDPHAHARQRLALDRLAFRLDPSARAPSQCGLRTTRGKRAYTIPANANNCCDLKQQNSMQNELLQVLTSLL